ncbi:CHC2 zinc finger domain-containing protein [Mycolicibacterium mucogenicum]|uniref:CHC2 zinc finger domain-containing protein n=1 Tax=Mycolicibacterium mucogenicum TaxID=56689 RepID=UPI00104255B7
MASDEPAIVAVIRSYFPGWDPPEDNGKTWIKVCCPFHGESRASSSISFEHNAFNCFACGVKGDAASIIRQQEKVSRAEAERRAAEVSGGSHKPVPPKSRRKSGRRVFGGPGSVPVQPEGRKVPSGVRSRPTPWA